MTPADEHGPITAIRCAACGADVFRADYGDCVYWADPAGRFVVAHLQCLAPYEEARRALLEHTLAELLLGRRVLDVWPARRPALDPDGGAGQTQPTLWDNGEAR